MAKRCTKCHRLKPDAEYRHRSGRTTTWCKWCHNQYTQSRRHLYNGKDLGPPEGCVTENQWLDLCAHYVPDGTCLACGDTGKLTMDHIVPHSKGGTNYIDNLQPLCLRCNSQKQDKETDFRPDGGEFAKSLRARGW